MKKYFVFLIVFLVILPSVFSTMGILCSSSDPAKIMVRGSRFEDSGGFLIEVRNLSDGDINVMPIVHDGVLVIEESSSGLIKKGEDILISGSYPTDRYISEQFLVGYTDQNGDKKETLITCSGASIAFSSSQQLMGWVSSLALMLLFSALGTIAITQGAERGKGKIIALGLFLLLLSAIEFFSFITFFFSHP